MHDLTIVDPDIELAAHDINVSSRVPVGSGVSGVGITEGDVDAWNLFVLENVADHVANGDVGADGKLTHSVAIFVGVTVCPENPVPDLC